MDNDYFFIAFYVGFFESTSSADEQAQTFNLHLNTTFFGITQVT